MASFHFIDCVIFWLCICTGLKLHAVEIFSFHFLLSTFFACKLTFDRYIGITEPIKSGIRDSRLGLGKQEQDDYYTAEENIQRKKLDIEVEETEELAKKREVRVF